MDCNYELFSSQLKGLTNQQVIDEIYKKMKEYCNLIEDDIPDSTKAYKEKLRLLFDKAALGNPAKMYIY